jgi:hypothetical protein
MEPLPRPSRPGLRYARAMLSRWVVALVVVAACGGDPASSWQTLSSRQPGSLLAVWGTSAQDVWVAGGRGELMGAPAILHFDGQTWSRVDSGQRGVDLWWVFGFAGGDVFFTGAGGTILRYRNAGFERMATPRSGTIFGLWGPAPDDLWAVGSGDDGTGIVWRYNGSQWSEVTPPGVPNLVLKVHGQRSDDVWISCAAGLTLHWDGTALTSVTSGVMSSLFSIVTTPEVAIAVGGYTGQGAIVEHTAGSPGWTTQPSPAPITWRGVAAGAGRVFAVGEAGVVGQRTSAGWSLVDQYVTQLTFHAAWVDPTGGLWGVGGMFDTLPLTSDGFLAYYGVAALPEVSL